MKEWEKAIINLAETCVVKVLEVRKTDEYKILYIDKREKKNPSPFLKDWVEDHINSQMIHEDYIDAFRHLINSERAFKMLKYKKYIHFKMKRRMNETSGFIESVITIIQKDKETLYLIVYNIE